MVRRSLGNLKADPENFRIVFTGPPGSGKSRKILDLFREARRDRSENRALFIVPDAGAREHTRDILARDPDPSLPKSLADSSIQTLRSHIRKLGFSTDASASHLQALIGLWVDQRKLDSRLSQILTTPGGKSSLASAILKLRNNGVDYNSFLRQQQLVLRESPILLETMCLWEEWLIGSTRLDSLIAFNKAADEVRTGDHNWSLVLVDGFTEILPPDWNLLSAIIEKSNRAAVALDPKQPPSEKLLEKLLGIGFHEEPVSAGPWRWSDGCILRWFAEVDNWKADAERPELPDCQPSGELAFIEATDPQVEASAIAREVASNIRNGRKPSDIAILAPNLGDFRKSLESEFRALDIPLRIQVDRPIIETGPGALMNSLLAIASGDWSDETICAMLSHPGSGIPKDEAAQASKYTHIKARIGKPLKWLEWAGKSKSEEILDLLTKIKALSDSGDISPVDFASSLIDLIDSPLRESWLDLDDAIFADESWTWDRVIKTIETVARALCDIHEKLPSNEIAQHLRDELLQTKARPLDRWRDCVNAITLLNARTWSMPVAIVSGLSREFFPRRGSPDPFLPDSLCEQLDPPIETSKERRERELALFRIATTRASDRLVLTRPLADQSGSPLLPSGPLAKCREWLGETAEKLTVRALHQVPLDLESALFPTDIASIAFHEGVTDSELLDKLGKKCDTCLAHAVRQGHYDTASLKDPGLLIQSACGSKTRPISPSELNNLAQCPFRFFASGILRLRDPDRDRVAVGLDYTVWGTIAHDALAAWQKSDRKGDLRDLARKAAEDNLKGIPWDSVLDSAVRQIENALERFRKFDDEYIKPLGFKPEYAEVVFGRAHDENSNPCDPVEFPIAPECTLILGGRIDRIDIDSRSRALIVDYKRSPSSVKGDLDRLAENTDFQLSTYIALVQSGMDMPVAAAFFAPITRIGVKEIKKVLADSSIADEFSNLGFTAMDITPSEHIEKMRDAIGELIENLKSGEITPCPEDSKLCGDKCSYHDLCRFRFTGYEGKGDEGGGD